MKKLFALLFVFAFVLCSCNAAGNGGTGDNTSLSDEKLYSFEGSVGTFYYPDEIYNNYLTVEREFDGTAQNVCDILLELGNYSEKITVNSYYVQGDTLYIDFGVEMIKEAHGGSAKEHFVIVGTANTLISCFKVKYVRLTVDGNDLITAHNDYSAPISLQK